MSKTDVLYLDPSTIVVGDNVRRKEGDLSALVASIGELGVLQPLVVEPIDDGYRLVFGGRRLQAAIKVGLDTVPCVIAGGRAWGENDGAMRVARQLAENLAREDLSDVDEAAGYDQLRAFGLDEVAIASATGRPVERVRSGLAVAASKTATKAAARYDLTIEQAAALADFADDKEAVKKLTESAVERPEVFPHVLSRLRQDRNRAEQRAVLAEKMRKRKIPVLGDRPSWGADLVSPRLLTDLADKNGKPLTASNHRRCPGHVAWIDPTGYKPTVEYACTAPKAHAHRLRSAATSTPVDTATSEQRRAVIDGNKAWRAAEPVRAEFLRDVLARLELPRPTMRFVVSEIAADPKSLHAYGADAVSEPEGRLLHVLLAQVGESRELSMGVHTWRNWSDHRASGGPSAAARWLAFLAGCGYPLSDIERQVK